MSEPVVSFDEAVELSFLNGWHEALKQAVGVLRLAREGEIDGDLRSLIWRIDNLTPETTE